MKLPEQIQFQGSAESKGFRPVVQASPTELMDREATKHLQNQQYVLSRHHENQTAVERSRVTSFGNGLENLAAFSQTISKHLEEEQVKRNEADMNEGLMQAYLDGVDPAEALAFDVAEGYLKDGDQQIQAIGDRAQQSGAPFMGVQKVRDLSGWKQYGYAMGMAQRSGDSYGKAMMDVLAEMPEGMSMEEKAVYLSNARSQWLQSSGFNRLNPALLNKYAFPQMREADSAILNNWRKEEENERKALMLDEAQTIMGAAPVANFGSALDMMVRGGMDRRKARQELLGQMKPDDLTELGGTTSWDGQLTWEEKYPHDFRQARRNAIANEVADYDAQQAAAALEGKQWFDQVQEEWEKNPPSDEDIEAAERFMSDNFNFVDGRLGERWKARTTDAAAKEYYNDQFDRLDRAGQLTEGMLNDPSVPSDVRNRYLGRAQALDKARRDTPEFKQYTKELEESLKRVAKQEGLEPSAPGLELAIAKAQADYQAAFSNAIKAGAPADQAALAAYQKIQAQIDAGAAGQGLYKFDPDPAKGFTGMTGADFIGPQPTRSWEQQRGKIEQAIEAAGVSAIDAVPLIPKSTLEDAKKNINSPNYQIPAIATHISDRFGGKISPWEVLNRQSIAQGLGALTPNPRLQSQTKAMSPAMQKLLTYRPSYNRVTRAYGSTSQFNPDMVPGGYGGVIQQAAAKYRIDPSVLAGLIEVESGYNPKAYNASGASGIAQIIPKWHPGVKVWNPNESIMYAAQYLDQLRTQLGSMNEAIYAYNSGPGAIRQSKENRDYFPKVMRAAGKYGFGSNGNPWRNPAFLNRGVAYVTGNIGPTSTGPHLDVKRTDGGDFPATALDPYVDVQSPGGSRVPLSRVGVTADAANHRSRGSHGIDYGTESGSKVFLKGGARVVASVKTEHGDKLTIKLPNGKQYTFLHGRSS
jgi:hypothetical protein